MYNVGMTHLPGRFVEPEVVVTHFHLKEGDQVADYGAGSGFFMQALSSRVGSDGRVYALEIQKQLVEKLGELARLQGLQNVETLWCDLEEIGGIPIPDGSLDVGVLANTLFMFEDKETAIKEIARTLRPGGTLYIVDWTESFAGMGPKHDMVVTEQAAKDLCESNGFTFERIFPAGDHHYGIAVRKL